MTMLENLTVIPDKPGILGDWTWLTGTGKRPLLLTAAGDAFVQDQGDGSVHFLNVSTAQIFQVAESAQAFDALLADPAFVEEYLCPHFVDHLRTLGKVLKRNQIYSYRVPLSLGGEVSADNVDVTNLEVHFSIAGQIARQIAGLPSGTPITGIRIAPPSPKPWWKFW
jgi:hypothetical protein